jgi:ketosteroid isomerase-like protein
MSTIAFRLTLVLLATLSTGPARPDGDAADGRAIRSVLDDFDAAVSERSIDKVMSTLAPSDDLRLFLPVPFVPMRVDGAATARKALEIFFQNIPKQATFLVTHHDTTVQVHGDSAVAYSYQILFLSAGALPTRLICRTTMILVKRDGRWRIVHLHSGALPEVSDFIPK